MVFGAFPKTALAPGPANDVPLFRRERKVLPDCKGSKSPSSSSSPINPVCPTFRSSQADYDPLRVIEIVQRSASAPINNSQSLSGLLISKVVSPPREGC